MSPKNLKFYVSNESYFIVDQYKKDTCFYDEDTYYYYDIDVDRISLYKKRDNEDLVRYNHLNKMDIVPLQLKIKNFYYEILIIIMVIRRYILKITIKNFLRK